MTRNLVYLGLMSTTLLASFSPIAAVAQVTPAHIAKMKTVTGSMIAENGNYIAYTLSDPADPKKGNALSQVHLYLYHTGSSQSLAYHTSSSVSQVTFRPAKGTLTFLSKRDKEGTNAIYEISVNGGEAKKIYAHTANIQSYTWSKDGNSLAFISAEKEEQPKTTLTYSPIFFEEELASRNAYIVNPVSPSATAQKLDINGSAYMMEWAPNGNQVAVSVAPTSSVDDSYMAQKIKIVNTRTAKVEAVIDNEGKLGQIAWSPDGQSIALVGAFDLHDPTDGSLLIASPQGGKPKVIDAQYQGKYESIIWKDARNIHFLASEGTGSALGTIQPDGQDKKYLNRSSDHHITSFSLSDNNKITFTANTAAHPSELFLLGSGKQATTQLTQSNEWLKGLKLGKQEVIRYKARDGRYDIEGMLIYPVDYKEGTRVPLITVVHGGPESHYSNGWLTAYSMPGQMGAAGGYAVFYPNYRGSTGRGVDFTYSSQSDLAGKEFDDIVDGVDYLIEKGIADKDRIGVTGGSYGGYASAWMSTYYSNRFAAAVMFVGISNNISKFGTSDIPSEMFLVHSKKRIWDDWQWQLERSPIYYADRAQTPILIMHGAEDPRVHPAQSMELYRHLKVRKPELPVRLVYYPGEGHGNARSGSRYDYNLRMMQWFDTYLKTGNAKAKIPNLDLPE